MNATNFKIHFRGVHEDTKDNKRNSCGKNFSLPENLKSHFKLFHECQKDHKCEICEKSFVRTRDLKGHIRAVHGEVRDDIECNICGKSVSNLSSHVKSVHHIVFGEPKTLYFHGHNFGISSKICCLEQ